MILVDSIKLHGSVLLNNRNLTIEYKITNETEVGIYVFVLAIDGRFKTYANDAFACLSRDRKVLQLLLGQSPVPDGISLSANVRPHAVLIAPHGHYENHVKLEFPIREWHANSIREYEENAEEIEIRDIKFMIEYVNQEETYFSRKTKHEGFFQVGGFPVNKLLLSLETLEPFKVLVRSGLFKRFTF